MWIEEIYFPSEIDLVLIRMGTLILSYQNGNSSPCRRLSNAEAGEIHSPSPGPEVPQVLRISECDLQFKLNC